ncbi:hypothetical protein [Streptomyces sp. NPDC048248]|uniref:hypothetical protein n=1 Tax=Streptomyces sp. NPDC048248 TaxID=3365523 RepID=UPI0037189E0A
MGGQPGSSRRLPRSAQAPLYGIHDGAQRDSIAYRAELTAFNDSPTCTPEPMLTGELQLP